MYRFTRTLAALCAGLAASLTPPAIAQTYPNKSIRLIVAFAPGGGTDIAARVLAQKLGESIGQQVVVDNRPGGNGVIGGGAVAKADPDGYTISVVSRTHVITPLLIPAPYDPVKDFTAITMFGTTEFVLVAHPGKVPANTVKELIEFARSRPGTLNYASSGNGSSGHLGMEQFTYATGTKMQHIPYKGVGLAYTDLVSGDVQLILVNPASALTYMQNGRIKALAVTGKKRISSMPHVPTFDEAGMAGFNANTWFGLIGPPNMPKAVVDRLASEVAKVMLLPDTRQQLAKVQIEPTSSTPDELARLMQSDQTEMARIIKAANIKIQ